MTRLGLKDPDEVLDYKISWSEVLAGDIIARQQWVLPSGITVLAQSHTDDSTTIWLGGGTDGVDYDLFQRVQTLIGRIFERRWMVRVRAK